MKNIFKQYIIYLLCFLLVFSNCLTTSYGMSGLNNNTNNSTANLGGGGDFGTSSGKFGLRFSLVDAREPDKVISVDNEGNPAVIDMWYCTLYQFKQYTETFALTNLYPENMYSAVKTQTLDKKNVILPIWLPDYITESTWDSYDANLKSELVKGASLLDSIPRWLSYSNGRFLTHGVELQNWEDENSYQNIKDLLSLVDSNGNYYFKTSETLNADNPKTVLDKDLEAYPYTVLMIEPLLLFTPCYYGTSIPIMNKQYGTVTNIIESMWDNENFKNAYNSASNKQLVHLNYKMTDVAWFALNLKVAPIFNFNNYHYMSKFVITSTQQEANAPLDWWSLNQTRDWTPYERPLPGIYKNGYALNVFWFTDLSSNIDTYDITTNPSVPEKSEPSDGKRIETDYGSNSLKFNIDKHYRRKDANGNYIEEHFFTTVNAPHVVNITEEVDKTGYKLKDWFTSTDGWLPETGKPATDYKWETVVKGQHKNGTYEGTGPQELTVKPTDPDNVLHLLYEYEGLPSGSTINTYDITTNPSDPAPSEPPIGKQTETEQGAKSLKFKIDKHYREKDPITGKVTEKVYHTTVDAPHTVIITDEKNKTGYALKDWFTSTDDWLPPAGGNAKDYPWETVVKGQHKNGQYSGTGETTLVVKPTDPDNVLHLLYEKSTVPTVIRVYDNEDGDTDKVEKDDVTEKPYKIPDGGSYEYVEVKTTPNSPKDVDDWSDSEGTSQGSPSRLDYPDGTKTIYVHYVKQSSGAEQTIKLYENELSYNYTLKDLLPNSNRSLIKIFDSVPSAPLSYKSCPGHHWTKWHSSGCYDSDGDGDKDSCDGHPRIATCTIEDKKLTDKEWTIALKDNFNQNSLSFIKNWVYTSPMSDKGIATFAASSGTSTYVRPQAEFLLIRNKDKDVVTLYPELNNSVKSKLNGLGLSEGYTSNDTRYNGLRELTRTRKFFDTLFTDLDYSSDYDNKLSWWTKKYGTRGSHENSGNYYTSHVSGHTPDVANEAYSKDNNVETHYFLGEEGLGDKKPSLTSSTWQKKFDKYNSNSDFVEDTLSFYPYLEYKYYDKGSSRANPVYVTSSNLSTMKVFNAYQIGVYKKNKINANLTSTQWSTHARSLSFLKDYGVSDKKSVLPGGAIQDIDMGNQGDTQIGLTLWQACLPDDVVVKVQNGFKTTVSQALSSVNTMKEEVKKSIEGYGLVQYGYVGASKDIKDILKNGEELHENIYSSLVTGNGGKTSNDAKYYLRQNGTGGSRANFNVLANRVENQVLYTISSDTKGKVTLKKKDMLSGNEIELGYITKGQSASNLINQSQEIKDLDANTKLITNFIQCIERNKGKDRSNNTWFNEAFNGVSVLMTNISYDVGFETNSATRTNVLDPLLVAKAESKSDLYNFEEDDKIRTSVYATTKKSTSVTSDVSGYLATVKKIGNMNDLVVNLTDIQSMVHTKNFYIPNATVSDLN